MKLWLISQDTNNDYDTYDSAVVVAETMEEARAMHPRGGNRKWNGKADYSWVNKEDVKVECIGEAKNDLKGVICASFHAG